MTITLTPEEQRAIVSALQETAESAVTAARRERWDNDQIMENSLLRYAADLTALARRILDGK